MFKCKDTKPLCGSRKGAHCFHDYSHICIYMVKLVIFRLLRIFNGLLQTKTEK